MLSSIDLSHNVFMYKAKWTQKPWKRCYKEECKYRDFMYNEFRARGSGNGVSLLECHLPFWAVSP